MEHFPSFLPFLLCVCVWVNCVCVFVENKVLAPNVIFSHYGFFLCCCLFSLLLTFMFLETYKVFPYRKHHYIYFFAIADMYSHYYNFHEAWMNKKKISSTKQRKNEMVIKAR